MKSERVMVNTGATKHAGELRIGEDGLPELTIHADCVVRSSSVFTATTLPRDWSLTPRPEDIHRGAAEYPIFRAWHEIIAIRNDLRAHELYRKEITTLKAGEA